MKAVQGPGGGAIAALDSGLYFRVTWQLEIAVAAMLLVASDVVQPWIVLPFLAAALIMVSPYGPVVARWHRLLGLVLGAGIAVIIGRAIMEFRGLPSVVEALVELITAGLPFLLMQPERPRSYWLATLNIVVIAVGAVALGSTSAVYVGFIAFMVLLLFNLNAAHLHLADGGGRRLHEPLPPGYFRQFLYVMPIGLLSAALIFVAFPRARAFSFGLDLGLKAKTGYSGVISLTGGGEIETSQDVAFLVAGRGQTWGQGAAPGELTAVSQMLFRGNALDAFDGVRWSSTVYDYRPRGQVRELRANRYHGAASREVVIFREPSTEATIFYPGVLVDVTPNTPGMGELQINSNGTLMRRSVESGRFQYTVRFADPPSPLATAGALGIWAQAPVAALAAAVRAPGEEPTTLSPSFKDLQANLVLPATVADAAYFREWRAELAVDPERQTLADVVRLLERHFVGGYVASMANEFSSQNTLAAFLSSDRRGHCEYFATATALLLRSLGVPARVAVGYKGGTFNQLIDMLEVREGNAHAWVEAFVPEAGWVQVDVTPPARDAGPGVADSWRLYANALSFWFREYVVDYDYESQRQLVKSLRGLGAKGAKERTDWRQVARQNAWPVAAVVVTALVVLVAVRLRRRRRAGAGLPLYYVRFAALMARRGLQRGSGETYGQFHARLRVAGVTASLVELMDDALEQELYGGKPLTPQVSQEALAAVQRESRRRRS